MKANVLKYIVFIGGILLQGCILGLVKDKFPSSDLFALDAVVCLLIYLCSYLSFGGVFSSTIHVGNKVASMGVLMVTGSLYSVLAAIGIAVGLLVPIAIEWQCIYQATFLFLVFVGLYLGATAEKREQAIYHQSVAAGESMGTLLSQAEHLRTRVLSSSATTPYQKEKTQLLVDRIKFISFNPSSAARALEGHISDEFSRMLTLLPSLPDAAAEWNASLSACEAWVTHRTRMVITQ